MSQFALQIPTQTIKPCSITKRSYYYIGKNVTSSQIHLACQPTRQPSSQKIQLATWLPTKQLASTISKMRKNEGLSPVVSHISMSYPPNATKRAGAVPVVVFSTPRDA